MLRLDVSAQQQPQEGRQGTSLLQRGGEPAAGSRQDGAADRSISGRDQRQQQAAWRKTLEVFDENEQRYATLSLFPEDRPIPADAVDSVQVKLSGMELRRPRVFGNCWLGCELWRQLGLDEFWRSDCRERGRR